MIVPVTCSVPGTLLLLSSSTKCKYLVMYLVITKLVVSTKQDFAFRQQELNSSNLPVQKITVSGTSTIVPVTWLVQYYFSVAVLSSSTKCKFLVLYLLIKTCLVTKQDFAFRQQELHSSHLPVQKLQVCITW